MTVEATPNSLRALNHRLDLWAEMDAEAMTETYDAQPRADGSRRYWRLVD